MNERSISVLPASVISVCYRHQGNLALPVEGTNSIIERLWGRLRRERGQYSLTVCCGPQFVDVT